MKPAFSEFSYGFALTSDLVERLRLHVRVAPLFPPVREEGPVGGGGVRMSGVGRLLFLQFKLSDCMVRNSPFRAKNDDVTDPYYRFYLRPRRYPRQHELLLSLEAQEQEAYYAAPGFHSEFDLDAALGARTTVARSIFVKPSAIGPLPDDSDYHFCFEAPDNGEALFAPAYDSQSNSLSGGDLLASLVDGLPTESLDMAIERALSVLTVRATLHSAEIDLPPLALVSALAATRIGCLTLVIQPFETGSAQPV